MLKYSDIGSLKRMSQMTPEELKRVFGLQNLPSSAAELDPRELPAESIEDFSYEGLDFEEAASQLHQHTGIAWYCAATCNRQSKDFPVYCSVLEKDIKLMGSFCVTKAVLEMQGQQFEDLEELDIEAMYGVTCFFFRKCGQAFEDLYQIAGVFSITMHDLERRWYELGCKLKATQQKIEKIKSGKISIDSILEKNEMFKPDPEKAPAKKDYSSLQYWDMAFPLIGAYTKQIKRERGIENWANHMNKRIENLKRKQEEDDRRYEARKAREAAKKAAAEKKAAEKAKKQSAGSKQQSVDNKSQTAVTVTENGKPIAAANCLESPKTRPADSSAQKSKPGTTGTAEVTEVQQFRAEMMNKARDRGDLQRMFAIAGASDEWIRNQMKIREEAKNPPKEVPKKPQKPSGNSSGKKKKKRKK